MKIAVMIFVMMVTMMLMTIMTMIMMTLFFDTFCQPPSIQIVFERLCVLSSQNSISIKFTRSDLFVPPLDPPLCKNKTQLLNQNSMYHPVDDVMYVTWKERFVFPFPESAEAFFFLR
jgi:hypothetical protein